MRKKRAFSSEFKAQVVLEALREDKTIMEIAAKHNISTKNINNWKKAFLSNMELAIDPSKPVIEYKQANQALQKKVDAYAKKVGQLTLERDFLEGKLKSLDSSKKQTLLDSKHALPITKQCHLLNASRGIYYYTKSVNTWQEYIDDEILKAHQEVPCYGALKMHKQLIEKGISVIIPY